MTQNASDVEIANQGFAAFRQDLNDVLEDITTLHSGDTAPTTTYANQFWYETDTDKLYIRNEDNDAWIEILTLDQANDHLATLGASITLDGTGNVSIDSGDFTVDTDTLVVDASSDNVGIRQTNPTTILYVGDGSDSTLPITFSTATGGTTEFRTTSSSGQFAFSNGNGSNEHIRIDGSGNVGIGTGSPQAEMHLHRDGSNESAIRFTNGTTGSTSSDGLRVGIDINEDGVIWMHDNEPILVGTNNTYRMQIDSSGNLLFKTTNTNPPSNNVQGVAMRENGGQVLANTQYAHAFGKTGDGNVVEFYSAGGKEGQISISGSTTSYGGFTGSHWSRLSDNTKPTILRGTVLESIGTMMDWYYAEFTTGSGDDAQTHKVSCAQPANKNVGDTFDFVVAADNEQGIAAGTYSATLRLEDDMKHVKVKVSDTSETKAIYGVFGSWDDEDDTVNDMNVAALGTYVVRVNSGETVAIGDLLDSNGDGTAKVQSDDLIRSRTIGKVISTVKQETYADGSYTVPCALFCS